MLEGLSPLSYRVNKPSSFLHSLGQVLQHSAHVVGSPLDHLQFVNACLELGEPKLDAVFQPWISKWNNRVDPLAELFLVQEEVQVKGHAASSCSACCLPNSSIRASCTAACNYTIPDSGLDVSLPLTLQFLAGCLLDCQSH